MSIEPKKDMKIPFRQSSDGSHRFLSKGDRSQISVGSAGCEVHLFHTAVLFVHGAGVLHTDIAQGERLPCLLGLGFLAFLKADDKTIAIGIFPQPGDLLTLQIAQLFLTGRIIQTAVLCDLDLFFPGIVQRK